MDMLAKWTTAVRAELGVGKEEFDPRLVLELARGSARTVARPAGSITAYLFGVAVGKGVPPREAAELVAKLIETWPRIDWRD
jgi:hypothetical protein